MQISLKDFTFQERYKGFTVTDNTVYLRFYSRWVLFTLILTVIATKYS